MESLGINRSVHCDDFIDSEKVGILTGMVFKTRVDGPAYLPESIDRKIDLSRELNRRLNDIVIVELQCQMRIVRRTHYLMQFLARSDANDSLRDVGCDRRRQIDYLNGRNLRYENLAPLHTDKIFENEIDALLQSDPEPSHARIGYR